MYPIESETLYFHLRFDASEDFGSSFDYEDEDCIKLAQAWCDFLACKMRHAYVMRGMKSVIDIEFRPDVQEFYTIEEPEDIELHIHPKDMLNENSNEWFNEFIDASNRDVNGIVSKQPGFNDPLISQYLEETNS